LLDTWPDGTYVDPALQTDRLVTKAQEVMSTLVSFQETAKVLPRNQTLHEQMCFIADDVVRYNFSDVAVHDARILKKMQCGEVRLWIIHELGSQLLPMSCKINEWRDQAKKNFYLCSLEVIVTRLLRIDALQKAQNKIILDSSKYFLVRKGNDRFSGSITPIKFEEVLQLVFQKKSKPAVD
jgi:hypothetical protein